MTTEIKRTGNVVRQTGRGGRDYEWVPTGEKFPSVTTLLGGLAKPALIQWAANEVSNEAIDRFSVLSEFLAAGDRDAAYQWLKGAHWRRRDKAADIGTAVHGYIEAAVLGTSTPEPTEAEAPYLRAALAAFEDHGFEFMMAEAPVFNRIQKYAGTLDAIATLSKGPHAGGPYLIDYKTHHKGLLSAMKPSEGPPYPEIALQGAAYRHAEFVGVADGSEQPMPETVGMLALILFRDGYRLVPVATGPEIFTAFLYSREAYRWMAVTSKGIFGEQAMSIVGGE